MYENASSGRHWNGGKSTRRPNQTCGGSDSEDDSDDSYLATALARLREWDERSYWCTYVFGVYVYVSGVCAYNYVSGVGVYNYVSGFGAYMLLGGMCLMFAFCIKFVQFLNIVFVVLFCLKKRAIFGTARYLWGLPDFSTRQSCWLPDILELFPPVLAGCWKVLWDRHRCYLGVGTVWQV